MRGNYRRGSEDEPVIHIPKSIIRWLVARMHVSRANWEVRADIKARCTGPLWTSERVQAAEDYAIQCMEDNRRLYRDVIAGTLTPPGGKRATNNSKSFKPHPRSVISSETSECSAGSNEPAEE